MELSEIRHDFVSIVVFGFLDLLKFNVVQLKSSLTEQMNNPFIDTHSSMKLLFIVASLLDPRYKKLPFLSFAERATVQQYAESIDSVSHAAVCRTAMVV